MAQLVAHPTPDREVGSSILSGLTLFYSLPFQSSYSSNRSVPEKAHPLPLSINSSLVYNFSVIALTHQIEASKGVGNFFWQVIA